MNHSPHFFPNRSAKQTFIFLLIGLFLLQAAVLFVFSLYSNLEQYRYSPTRLTDQILRTAFIAQALPYYDADRNFQQLKRSGIKANISSQPAPGSVPILDVKPPIIRQVLAQQGKRIDISIPLSGQRWLRIQHEPEKYSWALIGCGLLVLLLLAGMVALCAWAIKRLSIPLAQLAQAHERFGHDLQAPPLPETGTESLQVVIRAFNQMQDRIRQLLQNRTQMLAAISHDLRTPLTRLQLRLEYLQGSPQYEKALSDIHDMESMIASILFFARDSARAEVKERFDLNALLATLCDDFADAGQAVHFNEAAERVIFYGNMLAIKRALTNLIDNALAYGQQAEVFLLPQASELRIKINDQGPGIHSSEMENVFTPFYRLDAARSPQLSGAGLGLAVSRDIIRAHGGDISLHNCQPRGLSVIIDLPISEFKAESHDSIPP